MIITFVFNARLFFNIYLSNTKGIYIFKEMNKAKEKLKESEIFTLQYKWTVHFLTNNYYLHKQQKKHGHII